MSTMTAEENVLSPWAVIADDGHRIYALDAYSWDRNRASFENRDEFLAAVSGVKNSCTEELCSARVLVDRGSPAVSNPPNPGRIDPLLPLMRTLHIDIDLAPPGPHVQRQLLQLTTLLRALVLADAPIRRLVIRVRMTAAGVRNAAFLIDRVSELAHEHSICPEAIDWEVYPESLANQEGLLQVADRYQRVTILVVDMTDIGLTNNGPTSAQGRSVAWLLEKGAQVRIEVPTICPQDLPSRIGVWHALTSNAEISLRPLFLNSCEGYLSPFLHSPTDFDNALQTLLTLAANSRAILSIEPMRSILINAAIPGIARLGTSRRLSKVYLSIDGTWYRSKEHCAFFLASAFGTLFPFSQRLQNFSLERGASVDTGLPQCHDCALQPLCDSYWSPDMDLLMRIGEKERAQRVAAFSCALRTHLLEAFLREDTSSHHDGTDGGCREHPNAKTRVSFANGVVSYTKV